MMNQKMTTNTPQDLQNLLALAKDGEDKLKEISQLATELSQKCEDWYQQGLTKKQQ